MIGAFALAVCDEWALAVDNESKGGSGSRACRRGGGGDCVIVGGARGK